MQKFHQCYIYCEEIQKSNEYRLLIGFKISSLVVLKSDLRDYMHQSQKKVDKWIIILPQFLHAKQKLFFSFPQLSHNSSLSLHSNYAFLTPHTFVFQSSDNETAKSAPDPDTPN